jgi:hypothetical protein
MPTYYCWNCYHQVAAADRVCPECGRTTDPPTDVDYTGRLVWALGHPLPDRRVLAAQTLGRRGDPAAVVPLRQLVADPDPYLAAAALTSLVTLAGLDTVRDLVQRLAQDAPAPVRAAANRLLSCSSQDGIANPPHLDDADHTRTSQPRAGPCPPGAPPRD